MAPLHEDDELADVRRENAELRERLARAEYQAAKFEALCSIMAEAVMVLDRDGRFVVIEPTPGFPAEQARQLIGSLLGDGFAPDVAERMVAAIRRSLASGETGTFEFRVPVPGVEMWASAVFRPLTDDTVLWYSNDITSERRLQRAEQGLRAFEAIVERSPDGIAMLAADGRCTYANQAYRGLTSEREAGEIEAVFADLVSHPEIVETVLGEALAHGHWTGPIELGRDEAARVPCQVSLVRLPVGSGGTAAVAVIARDLRAFIAAECERVALQEQVIDAQRVALRELSTPLLPLADGVLCMPLVGAIDSARAQEMMERLLGAIVAQRAHTAILDVTGVRVPDAQVADGILQVARAAKLLGAEVVLTGISPEVAQQLVELQAILRGITTLSDLQSGIAYALRGGRAGARRR